MSKADMIRALENGNGVQHLLNAAYGILHNPMYIIDIDYNLLAHTVAPDDDPNWQELTTTGTFGIETQMVLADAGLLENITNADSTVTLRDETLRYGKIASHVFNKDNARVALLMMTEYASPFVAGDSAALGALAEKITAEIREYGYFTTLTMTQHEEKINLLLDGSATNPILYNPQAQAIYDGFEDYLYIAVIRLAQNEMLDSVHRNRLMLYKSFLKTKFPEYKFSVYGTDIIMLMSAKTKYFSSAPLSTLHLDLFVANDLHMGVSESFENIYTIRTYYTQAVAALEQGLQSGVSQRVFLHQDEAGLR